MNKTHYLKYSDNNKYRIISIDGCHTKDATLIDLKNAVDILTDDGIIIIDDYFNNDWPGVKFGVDIYLSNNNSFRVIYIGANKLILCRRNMYDKYIQILKKTDTNFAKHYEKRCWIAGVWKKVKYIIKKFIYLNIYLKLSKYLKIIIFIIFMCGIYNIINYKSNNIFQYLINGLFHLQHRGQESSGIALYNNYGNINSYKSHGLLKNLVKTLDKNIQGYIGFGHLRYSTNTDKSERCIQPYLNDNIILCYNGNIYNTEYIYNYLINNNIKCESKIESYLFMKLIELLSKTINKISDIELFIKSINNICKGAYSVIIYIKDIGLISFKDYYGMKPLLHGGNTDNFAISSESIGLYKNDIEIFKDLYNDEYIYVSVFNNVNILKYDNHKPYSPCIFEYIYISRIDSILNNVSIYKARYNMGIYLAKRIKMK